MSDKLKPYQQLVGDLVALEQKRAYGEQISQKLVISLISRFNDLPELNPNEVPAVRLGYLE